MDWRVALAATLFVLPGLWSAAGANVVFKVHHKFAGRRRSIGALRDHDRNRHRRILSPIDLPLGGNGHPSETGLYFAKLGIGTPSKDYHVQVDTGSDILWVNCVGCNKCPKKSDIGLQLMLYDLKTSATGNLVTCDQDFCTSMYEGKLRCKPELPCQYNIVYGDGSSTAGSFVKDVVQLDQASGDFQTKPVNGTVIFGCGSKQSGELGSSNEALDGILGFGQSNSSMISQLASAGKVKKMFAHCLDTTSGGGIFAIGQVVQPKLNMIPLVPDQPHYNVVMKGIDVGDDVLSLPTDIFGTGIHKGTIIDSGTTLAYFPRDIYTSLIDKIMARQPGLKQQIVDDQFTCLVYTGNVDDGFPVVTLHFEDSISLTVYPHEYMFQIRQDSWCFGWQNGGMQSEDGKDIVLLGDLVLSNRLVVYDLENHTIGWTEYNCSSSIKVKDEASGGVYAVGAHHISWAPAPLPPRIPLLLLLLALFMSN